ncbi:MAG: potassium channel protein [Nitrospirae bacterium]|nr:potassium channel protein [Nitrospirota bacterium]
MAEEISTISAFKKKFLLSFSLFILTLTVGTIGYWLIAVEEYPLIDYIYMTVITVATVGYREVIDVTTSTSGKLFTIFLIFAGMSVILYFLSNATAFLIEGDIKEIFWRKKMQKLIGKMKDHYIVCGIGRLGLHVVEELHQTGRQAVVIDNNPARVEEFKERFSNIGVVIADATDSEVLEKAGIAYAGGLIVTTGSDKDNLVITLSARQSCPNLRIVTRCNDIKNTERLKKAGADSVVSSNLIGGLRMASEMIRPTVVTFLDQMLRDRDKNLRVEEIRLTAGSPLIGRQIGGIKRQALILALLGKDGSYAYNPSDEILLEEGMALIFMGSPEDRKKLEG